MLTDIEKKLEGKLCSQNKKALDSFSGLFYFLNLIIIYSRRFLLRRFLFNF